MICSSARGGPRGDRLPCSQFRIVSTGTPIRRREGRLAQPDTLTNPAGIRGSISCRFGIIFCGLLIERRFTRPIHGRPIRPPRHAPLAAVRLDHDHDASRSRRAFAMPFPLPRVCKGARPDDAYDALAVRVDDHEQPALNPPIQPGAGETALALGVVPLELHRPTIGQ